MALYIYPLHNSNSSVSCNRCGRECFDGIDNDHDGKKDCADKDCQFDPMARKHCKEVNYGTRENGFGGGRECLLTEKGKEAKDTEKDLKRQRRRMKDDAKDTVAGLVAAGQMSEKDEKAAVEKIVSRKNDAICGTFSFRLPV